jgi:hypothetical protein
MGEGVTINEGGDWEEVEGLVESLPGIGTTVLANDLLVEAIGA